MESNDVTISVENTPTKTIKIRRNSILLKASPSLANSDKITEDIRPTSITESIDKFRYEPVLIQNNSVPIKVASRRKSSYDMTNIAIDAEIKTNSTDSFIQSAPSTSKVRRSSLLLAGINNSTIEDSTPNQGQRSSATTVSSKDSRSDSCGSLGDGYTRSLQAKDILEESDDSKAIPVKAARSSLLGFLRFHKGNESLESVISTDSTATNFIERSHGIAEDISINTDNNQISSSMIEAIDNNYSNNPKPVRRGSLSLFSKDKKFIRTPPLPPSRSNNGINIDSSIPIVNLSIEDN